MSDTIRINTTPNGSDKYLKVNLKQDFDFIEILSLKISQEDAYRKFCSDYGAIVGRVIINNGFGVPNAKVSVFIPLDDIDKNDPLISGLYPYEVITDKDSDGIRYNLLPRNGDPTNDCYTPVGTFPNKREILDNDVMLEVYCKYYKFTTTTNHAGDFMLFGVPVGNYVIHLDADISDIGIASQRPYDLISQGTPTKLFDSPTKFKGDKNLDKLIQIKTMNSAVNVQPFWGDTENCEIGINRLDFDLNYTLIPTAIFMGGIFGDQDKHSINKHCRPRRQLGTLCEQIVGSGSIEMVRKTLDDTIEDFNIDGGRVIDNDGTWAYQIPMNLDYMVTSETGDLIFSQDTNVGIPTRASVRFKIGMDETGGEGRLRTRAKYLVPNNPNSPSDVDYEFGPNTQNVSFRNLYWNKIYSVSNFIPRFQRFSQISTRTFTGIKNVDSCTDKTPFPYNRVNTNINPIFSIICLIIKIIGFLIWVMNKLLIPLINLMIDLINTIIGGIVKSINDIINAIDSLPGIDIDTINFTPINHIACVFVQCPSDDNPHTFAPGCDASSSGYQRASDTGNHIDRCPNCAGYTPSGNIIDLVGLDDCIAFVMAKALDIFQFDFYNDWINGSLFGYLLKYKKKKKHKKNEELFCDYECSDFPSSDGVNDCHNFLLLDTCFIDGNGSSGTNSQNVYYSSNNLRDGLIKNYNGDFYYASTTHDTSNKLFATDIINLGSVFDCDWQGVPKIQNYLIPSTYKIPPDTEEDNDLGVKEVCGMVDIDNNGSGLFFEIDCIGLHVDETQCLNIRHICEIGVNIDETDDYPSDCIIGSYDIDDTFGVFVRDVFYGLNSGSTLPISFSSPPINGTSFNINNIGIYDYTSTSNNGANYISFRGYNGGDNNYVQPKHSFYFYFGLLPGKTGLDKMNERFFTNCNIILRDDIIIQSSSIADLNNNGNGSITFSVVGGKGNLNYTVIGVAPVSFSTSGVLPQGTQTTINGLGEGTYIISGTDSLGTPVTRQIVVSGPTPLYSVVSVTKNGTTATSNDGQITISSVGGGKPNYTYLLTTYNGTIISGPAPLSTPKIINGLSVDNINGYIVTITDSNGQTSVTNNLIVSGPTPISIVATKTDSTCYNGNDGKINIVISGGQYPYTLNTTGPNSFSSSDGGLINLIPGTYVTNVVDNLGNSTTVTTVLNSINPQMILTSASSIEIQKQCDPSQYQIPFYYTIGGTTAQEAGTTPLLVQYSLNSGVWVDNPLTIPTIPSTTPMILNIPSGQVSSSVRIRFKSNDGSCFSNVLKVDKTSMDLPPNILTITPDTSFNLKQCTPNSVTFKFNISHLVRSPYNIVYSINGGPLQTTSTSSNPNIITSSVVGSVANIILSVTDNVGCIATSSFSINLPTSVLTANITRTSGSGGYTYTYVVSGTGGIVPYSGTGNYLSNSSTYSTTITDSVGCSATKNY